MKKTVNLEDSIVDSIERLQTDSGDSFDSVLNRTLRDALGLGASANFRGELFVTRPVDVGKCRFDNLDDVESVLAAAEGELRK